MRGRYGVKNKIDDIIHRKIMLRYSAINSRAKPPPPYSVLKPDTSSDSPSTKSNGARLVSARVVMNQSAIINGIKMKSGMTID